MVDIGLLKETFNLIIDQFLSKILKNCVQILSSNCSDSVFIETSENIIKYLGNIKFELIGKFELIWNVKLSINN